MTKLGALNSWESAIAVLQDNIFGVDASLLESLHNDFKERVQEYIVDRRKEPRFSLSLPVHHRIRGNAKWDASKTVDISQNGIRLALNARVTVGTELELSVKLPNLEEPVQMSGVVVWEKPSQNQHSVTECGVAFENYRNAPKKGKIIHFMADRLAKMALRETHNMKCEPVTTIDEIFSAYHLVYREYLVRRYCRENPAEIQYNFFSLLPESRTLLLKIGDRIVGTISLIVDSPCGLPMETLFGEQIGKLRREGRKLAEVSMLALDQSVFGRKSFALTDFKKLSASFTLFKTLFDYARYVSGITDLFITMHPKHEDLYSYLTFKTIGPVKSYSGAEGNAALPMHLDVGKAVLTAPKDLGITHYFLEERTPYEILDKRFHWTPEAIELFLFVIRPLWAGLPATAKEYFKNCYPKMVFG